MCFLILLLTLFLVGCGNQPTQTTQSNQISQSSPTPQKQTIRESYLNDAKELFVLLDANYKNGILLSEGDLQKIRIYQKKYSSENTKDFSEMENELYHAMNQMIVANGNYSIGRVKSDEKLKSEALHDYIEGSEKAKKILDIK
jgi:hypothetical protein